jgi:archaellum component FlaG (FlaF/FlaG flagellin family)
MSNMLNEKSTGYVTVKFYGKDGVLQSPSSVSYRIDDVMTGTEIKGLTSVIAPSSEIEIILSPADNLIVTPRLSSERHRLTVIATYGANDQLTESIEFTVRNLSAIT